MQAIRIVNQGSVWAPRRVLSMFIERVSSTLRGGSFPAGRVTFTDREKEVLEMLVAGRSNKEIGSALGIEERTVKAHVAKLMRKVGVQNRIALSVHAITHSLVTAKEGNFRIYELQNCRISEIRQSDNSSIRQSTKIQPF